jgi:hypothetical protein
VSRMRQGEKFAAEKEEPSDVIFIADLSSCIEDEQQVARPR